MKTYHHRKYSTLRAGMTYETVAKPRYEAPHYSGDEFGTRECITRQMTDEEHAHMIALLNRKRRHRETPYNDNPALDEGGDLDNEQYF